MGCVRARGDTFLTFGLKALTETNTSSLATGLRSIFIPNFTRLVPVVHLAIAVKLKGKDNFRRPNIFLFYILQKNTTLTEVALFFSNYFVLSYSLPFQGLLALMSLPPHKFMRPRGCYNQLQKT
jgi:hypothetical protein